jgi:hypothetical protein
MFSNMQSKRGTGFCNSDANFCPELDTFLSPRVNEVAYEPARPQHQSADVVKGLLYNIPERYEDVNQKGRKAAGVELRLYVNMEPVRLSPACHQAAALLQVQLS